MTNSHEVGHTLGLRHDGRLIADEEYYAGHGTGATGWGPIMGAPFSKSLVTWSKGEYPDASRTEDDLLQLVIDLNADERVDGILVQLPLPEQIDAARVIATIDPAKDVDGFHAINAGRLATGLDALVPCTPLGCLHLLKQELGDLDGREAVVVGRSNIVGKPMAQLLLGENATVTIAHSRTRDLADVVRRADIVVTAVGRAEMVRGAWIKPGATVIDVGINRIATVDGKGRLVGDVAYDEAAEVAAAISPVPGGVGPMTIAMLMRNTLVAAHRRAGLADPEEL
jgi:methylenetetrahydrofolate dehydrogenase (NADP+)/methenyltetrahydrofolate cyclohydrolase